MAVAWHRHRHLRVELHQRLWERVPRSHPFRHRHVEVAKVATWPVARSQGLCFSKIRCWRIRGKHAVCRAVFFFYSADDLPCCCIQHRFPCDCKQFAERLEIDCSGHNGTFSQITDASITQRLSSTAKGKGLFECIEFIRFTFLCLNRLFFFFFFFFICPARHSKTHTACHCHRLRT